MSVVLKLVRTGLLVEDFVKHNDMSFVLQLVKYMSNRTISFERKGVTSMSAQTETSSQDAFRNQPNNLQTNSYQPKAILSRSRSNFFEHNHDENTCEVKKNTTNHIFGKRDDTNIVALVWAP
jgi:hypothetical protein